MSYNERCERCTFSRNRFEGYRPCILCREDDEFFDFFQERNHETADERLARCVQLITDRVTELNDIFWEPETDYNQRKNIHNVINALRETRDILEGKKSKYDAIQLKW